MDGLKTLKPLDGFKGQKSHLDRMPVFRQGPERFSKLKGEPEYKGGPGEPPDGFVVSSTSASEWPPYWALCVIFGFPTRANHRNPPFIGRHGLWAYQLSVRNVLGHPFSSDFVIDPSSRSREGVSIRIQTEHYHIFAPSGTQAFDRRQRQGVEANYRVIDIYDYLFLQDKSGAAIIKYVKMAMAGIEPSVLPMSTGHARRSRQR